jgi:hypothetical protein
MSGPATYPYTPSKESSFGEEQRKKAYYTVQDTQWEEAKQALSPALAIFRVQTSHVFK